jgi:hypothetical protein
MAASSYNWRKSVNVQLANAMLALSPRECERVAFAKCCNDRAMGWPYTPFLPDMYWHQARSRAKEMPLIWC